MSAHMKSPLYNFEGAPEGVIEIPDLIFARAWNADLVHQSLLAQEANARATSAQAKTRGEVHGGGRKPWRQKGTGRARHGSIRSPLWKGGGVTFGPRREKIFAKKINRKMRQLAVFVTLSRKLKEGEAFFISDLTPSEAKTRVLEITLARFFQKVGSSSGKGRVLLITPGKDRALERASRNLKRVAVLQANSINIRDLLLPKWILIGAKSVPVIEKTYAKV